MVVPSIRVQRVPRGSCVVNGQLTRGCVITYAHRRIDSYGREGDSTIVIAERPSSASWGGSRYEYRIRQRRRAVERAGGASPPTSSSISTRAYSEKKNARRCDKLVSHAVQSNEGKSFHLNFGLSSSSLHSIPTKIRAGKWGRRSSPLVHSSSSSLPASATVCAELTGAEKKQFVWTRLRVFFGILIGYSCYYLTRNSLNFTAPVMVATESLHLDISSIGVITSVFPLFYGCSKFVSGVVGDRLSPRVMLSGGLLMTSLINISFGFSSNLKVFCVLWAMNGILQGFGAPSCAKILTSWFASKERGTYWGMWNIAHNLGGFAAPLVAGTAARNGGWRWGLWAPGSIGVLASALLVIFIRDSPEATGFPPVEVVEETEVEDGEEEDGEEEGEDEEKDSLLKTLFDKVLSNPRIWALALVYFCVYIVRQGITSWSVFYLINAKGAGDAAVAALRVSGLELGGLVGSLLAGKVSDHLIKTAKPGEGLVGKRIKVVSCYLVGIAAMLAAFWAVPASRGLLQWFIVFMIGFFLYGPQMLIGLCGAEIVGRESVGASEGFLGWVAYLGAANAGIPLSILVKKLGWEYFFVTLVAACGIAMLLLIPLLNAKSYIQREEEIEFLEEHEGA